MATTSITIRMDAKLKKEFEAFCDDVGLTMTSAITLFARKTVRDYMIPFEINGDRPNKETIKAINEVKQMESDPAIGKTYDNVDQMMQDILSNED